MVFSSPLVLILLLAVMVGSLVLAQIIQARQDSDVIRLYRLAALDRRSAALIKVIRGLKALDDNQEVVKVLMGPLKNDLARIQRLDPARGNGEQELRSLTADAGKTEKPPEKPEGQSKTDKRTSLSSDREVFQARALITDALSLIRHLYQIRQVTGDQLESTARHLGMLSALVGVNSNIHMADIAMAHGDLRKASAHFRAAESFLLSGPLKGAGGAEKLKYIESRREQISHAERQRSANDDYADRAA